MLSQLSHINTIGSIHCGCVLQFLQYSILFICFRRALPVASPEVEGPIFGRSSSRVKFLGHPRITILGGVSHQTMGGSLFYIVLPHYIHSLYSKLYMTIYDVYS